MDAGGAQALLGYLDRIAAEYQRLIHAPPSSLLDRLMVHSCAVDACNHAAVLAVADQRRGPASLRGDQRVFHIQKRLEALAPRQQEPAMRERPGESAGLLLEGLELILMLRAEVIRVSANARGAPPGNDR